MTCGLVATVLAGCGGHSAPARHATAGPCTARARLAFAGALGVSASAVSAVAGTGNNTYPQCSYRAVIGSGRRVVAVANIDTGPQPYFILERTQVEASQVFTAGAQRLYPAPTPVKLGLDAWWFPGTTYLMTTEGIRLYTVTISWRGVAQKMRRDLAIAVARTYLLPPRKRGATGYPSG
jgi:hypothetical protein